MVTSQAFQIPYRPTPGTVKNALNIHAPDRAPAEDHPVCYLFQQNCCSVPFFVTHSKYRCSLFRQAMPSSPFSFSRSVWAGTACASPPPDKNGGLQRLPPYEANRHHPRLPGPKGLGDDLARGQASRHGQEAHRPCRPTAAIFPAAISCPSHLWVVVHPHSRNSGEISSGKDRRWL